MKRYIKGFYMSLGMFWAIPQPFNFWDNSCTNLMLPCFPIVGGLIGSIWWGVAELVVFGKIHIMLAAAVLAVLPFFVTGFLHLDGYMDTSDAVLSRRPLEDKLRILKDPHTGAFAVIMLGILFVLQFAAVYAVIEKDKYFTLLVVIAVISRCGSAMALLCLKTIPQSGYANMFRQNTGLTHRIFVMFTAVVAIAVSYVLAGISGVMVAGAAVLGSVGAMAYAYKEFKGVSGDLAGYALVVSELCGLIALAVI